MRKLISTGSTYEPCRTDRESGRQAIVWAGACLAAVACASGGGPPPESNSTGGLPLPGARPATRPALSSAGPTDALDEAVATPLLEALASELERGMRELRRQKPAPHFIAYQVHDRTSLELSASDGALDVSALKRRRSLDVDVRVGSPAFDSGRAAVGLRPLPPILAQLPLTDDPAALRAETWSATINGYRQAAERFAELQTRASVEAAAGQTAPDFTEERPERYVEPVIGMDVDRALWETRLRAASARFRNAPNVIDSAVSLHALALNRSFVSTEGARIRTGEQGSYVSVWARTYAPDGESLDVLRQFHAHHPSQLPSQAALDEAAGAVIAELEALRRAPVGDVFDGPALLEGPAAGVFMHEVLGHRMESEKLKDDNYGQTFARKLGQHILPSFLSVYDDPTVTRLGDTTLVGAYRFDDEGVRAQRVFLVEDGVLRAFLLGRTPLATFSRSNGHGRRREGYPVFARQGNLIVQPSVALSRANLRAALRAEAQRQGKSYGLLVADIRSGSTQTGVGPAQSLTVRPTKLYRVYVDGRPDEQIRGVNLVGTPLTVLSKIMAAGDDYAVFNGSCGSASGPVPVGAISPALLLRQLETQRVHRSTGSLPIIDRPSPEPQERYDDAVRQAMAAEMARAVKGLRLVDHGPPHHVSFTVIDAEFAYATAAFGAVTGADRDRQRNLRVDLRVGDPRSDSGNFVDPEFGPSAVSTSPVAIDDDAFALRKDLWRITDREYKRAVRLLGKKRALRDDQGARTNDAPADWSGAVASSTNSAHKGAEEPINPEALAEIAKALSAELRAFPAIQDSNVSAVHHRVRRRVLTSEGSWKDERTAHVEIFVTASTQAGDGMPLQNRATFESSGPRSLPPLSRMQQTTRQMAAELVATKAAPVPESGSAVVVFAGRASAQLLRQILAQQLSGTAPALSASASARELGVAELADKLGQEVAPPFFTAVDDPSARPPAGSHHFGSYVADDEAVPAQRVSLIKAGVLTDVYMSRTPGKQRARSNGHGRGAPLAGAVRGQAGALIVSAGNGGLPDAALTGRALREARGTQPVYLVRALATSAGAMRPLVIDRVNSAGQLRRVRGLSFNNLRSHSLRDIVAMGRTPYVYNYLTSRSPAEGGAPGTLVAPALVIKGVEVRADGRAHPRPPLYPHPSFSPTVSQR